MFNREVRQEGTKHAKRKVFQCSRLCKNQFSPKREKFQLSCFIFFKSRLSETVSTFIFHISYL